MATIAENLLALQQTKENIKTAIEGKGQDLTDVPFTQYADKINAIQTGGGEDRLQWKCDNMKSLNAEFKGYTGENLDVLKGLDTSQVTDMTSLAEGCSNLTTFPLLDTSNVKTFDKMFYNCINLENVPLFDMSNGETCLTMFSYCKKLKTLPNLDMSNISSVASMFSGCIWLDNAPLVNLKNVTNVRGMFDSCGSLETATEMDLVNVLTSSNTNNLFYGCQALKNINLHNIRVSLKIGQTTSYGKLLTLDSIVNTIKELWDLTGSTSPTLTMSTQSKNLIAEVYVKLVDVTDEMLTQDQYAANKKPCVVCESTDEGAMLITEYLTSKNWKLA